MHTIENAPGTACVRGGGGEIRGYITYDSVILAARKALMGRLSRTAGLSPSIARLTVELALGGANGRT